MREVFLDVGSPLIFVQQGALSLQDNATAAARIVAEPSLISRTSSG